MALSNSRRRRSLSTGRWGTSKESSLTQSHNLTLVDLSSIMKPLSGGSSVGSRGKAKSGSATANTKATTGTSSSEEDAKKFLARADQRMNRMRSRSTKRGDGAGVSSLNSLCEEQSSNLSGNSNGNKPGPNRMTSRGRPMSRPKGGAVDAGSSLQSSKSSSKPAFPGAKFDSKGFCIHHPNLRLQERVFDEWRIYHRLCPRCDDDRRNNRVKGNDTDDRIQSNRPVRSRERGRDIGENYGNNINRNSNNYRSLSLGPNRNRSLSRPRDNRQDGQSTIGKRGEYRLDGKLSGEYNNPNSGNRRANNVVGGAAALTAAASSFGKSSQNCPSSPPPSTSLAIVPYDGGSGKRAGPGPSPRRRPSVRRPSVGPPLDRFDEDFHFVDNAPQHRSVNGQQRGRSGPGGPGPPRRDFSRSRSRGRPAQRSFNSFHDDSRGRTRSRSSTLSSRGSYTSPLSSREGASRGSFDSKRSRSSFSRSPPPPHLRNKSRSPMRRNSNFGPPFQEGRRRPVSANRGRGRPRSRSPMQQQRQPSFRGYSVPPPTQSDVQVDKNGCCIFHPFVQLHEKKTNGGWRVLLVTCHACEKDDIGGRRHRAPPRNHSFHSFGSQSSPQRIGRVSPNSFRSNSRSPPHHHHRRTSNSFRSGSSFSDRGSRSPNSFCSRSPRPFRQHRRHSRSPLSYCSRSRSPRSFCSRSSFSDPSRRSRSPPLRRTMQNVPMRPISRGRRPPSPIRSPDRERLDRRCSSFSGGFIPPDERPLPRRPSSRIGNPTNSNAYALVVRERTPSPEISVELNPRHVAAARQADESRNRNDPNIFADADVSVELNPKRFPSRPSSPQYSLDCSYGPSNNSFYSQEEKYGDARRDRSRPSSDSLFSQDYSLVNTVDQDDEGSLTNSFDSMQRSTNRSTGEHHSLGFNRLNSLETSSYVRNSFGDEQKAVSRHPQCNNSFGEDDYHARPRHKNSFSDDSYSRPADNGPNRRNSFEHDESVAGYAPQRRESLSKDSYFPQDNRRPRRIDSFDQDKNIPSNNRRPQHRNSLDQEARNMHSSGRRPQRQNSFVQNGRSTAPYEENPYLNDHSSVQKNPFHEGYLPLRKSSQEWSEHNPVRSKATDLSALLQKVNSTRGRSESTSKKGIDRSRSKSLGPRPDIENEQTKVSLEQNKKLERINNEDVLSGLVGKDNKIDMTRVDLALKNINKALDERQGTKNDFHKVNSLSFLGSPAQKPQTSPNNPVSSRRTSPESKSDEPDLPLINKGHVEAVESKLFQQISKDKYSPPPSLPKHHRVESVGSHKGKNSSNLAPVNTLLSRRRNSSEDSFSSFRDKTDVPTLSRPESPQQDDHSLLKIGPGFEAVNKILQIKPTSQKPRSRTVSPLSDNEGADRSGTGFEAALKVLQSKNKETPQLHVVSSEKGSQMIDESAIHDAATTKENQKKTAAPQIPPPPPRKHVKKQTTQRPLLDQHCGTENTNHFHPNTNELEGNTNWKQYTVGEEAQINLGWNERAHPEMNAFQINHFPNVLPQNEEDLPIDNDWKKYQVGDSKRKAGGREKKSKNKMSGKVPSKFETNEREIVKSVKQMPFTDQFGDFGMYTGQVNEDGRPDGKGSMKYDNGVFYEGTWTDGCQDQKAASQYNRIRGGFTSWQGKGKQSSKSGMVLPWNARKNDVADSRDSTNVRGMEWTDLNGDSGRYTGEVNRERLPHGRGIMKYDFGLIAEGDWVNGVLKEGPQDRLMGAAAAMSGGRSVGPGISGAASMMSNTRSLGGGMSVGPSPSGFGGGMPPGVVGGGMSVGPMSVGPMSVGPGSTFGSMGYGMAPMGPMMGGMNPMMATRASGAAQHALVAQQNAMMKSMGAYGGGSVYGAPTFAPMQVPMQMPMQMPMQPQMVHPSMPQPHMMQPHMQPSSQPAPQENDKKPPISVIKIP